MVFVFAFLFLFASKVTRSQFDLGYDERFPRNYTEPILIEKITQHYHAKKLLDKLENPRISIYRKMDMLPPIHSIYPENIFYRINETNDGNWTFISL